MAHLGELGLRGCELRFERLEARALLVRHVLITLITRSRRDGRYLRRGRGRKRLASPRKILPLLVGDALITLAEQRPQARDEIAKLLLIHAAQVE